MSRSSSSQRASPRLHLRTFASRDVGQAPPAGTFGVRPSARPQVGVEEQRYAGRDRLVADLRRDPRLRSSTSVLEPNTIAAPAATISSSRPASEAIAASIPAPWISNVGSPRSRGRRKRRRRCPLDLAVEAQVDALCARPPLRNSRPRSSAAGACEGDRRARPTGRDGDVREGSADMDLESPAPGVVDRPRSGRRAPRRGRSTASRRVARAHQREDRFCGMAAPIEERFVEIGGIRMFLRERRGAGRRRSGSTGTRPIRPTGCRSSRRSTAPRSPSTCPGSAARPGPTRDPSTTR